MPPHPMIRSLLTIDVRSPTQAAGARFRARGTRVGAREGEVSDADLLAYLLDALPRERRQRR
jgi:hypothetical protein